MTRMTRWVLVLSVVCLVCPSWAVAGSTTTPAANPGYQGPCSIESKTFVAINQTTGTQLITGAAGLRTYVCSFHIITATAQNIALVSGTGTVCATSLGPMAGGTTAATGWNFAANGGIVLGAGIATVMKSDTDGDNICLLQSSSGQISGTISYVASVN